MRVQILTVALLVAHTLGHRVHQATTTTEKVSSRIEKELEYYDDRDILEVSPQDVNVTSITDSPTDAVPQAPETTYTIFGYECTIQSSAYPGEYLRMSSGYFHYYPTLRPGNPIKRDDSWDWSAIWKIFRFQLSADETYYLFQNNKCETFMTYNATRYSFVRGASDKVLVDNAWIVSAKQHADGHFVSNIQHASHPNGYLHALTSKKLDDRPVGITTHTPDKDIYEWKIVCDKGKTN